MRKSRLRWHGHVMRRNVSFGIRRIFDVGLTVAVGSGRPRVRWKPQVEKISCDKMKIYLLCIVGVKGYLVLSVHTVFLPIFK